MAEVDREVSEFFKSHLSSWKNALARWHKKCEGKNEKEKVRLKRDFPVADRRGPVSSFDRNAAVSDATPYGYPSKSLDDQKKESEIDKQAAKCKEVIKHIQKMMELLNNARTTGRFPSVRHVTISVRKKPSFISGIDREHKVDRGEVVEVLKKKGDWLQVKTADTEGWIHKTELMPTLPHEGGDVTAPRSGGPGTAGDSDIETGVRDTVGAI